MMYIPCPMLWYTTLLDHLNVARLARCLLLRSRLLALALEDSLAVVVKL